MTGMWVVLVAVALVIFAPAESEPSGGTYDRSRLGLSVTVPDGWTIVRRQLSACTDPAQRIALRRGRALVQIVEHLGPDVSGFPRRPHRFELLGKPEWLACCPPLDGKGWFITFRDGGRGFYAYVYVEGGEKAAEALEILDSLRVGPPEL